MSDVWRMRFEVDWRSVDALGHMANTAYLDRCVDVRFGYFGSRGVDASRMLAERVGPVVRRDQVDYFRELKFRDPYEVDLRIDGLSADGSHFRLANRFWRGDGKRAAQVVSEGGWLDLERRALIAPPRPILDALEALERTGEFETLESSLR